MGLGFGDWVFGVCLGFVGDWGLGVSRMSCGVDAFAAIFQQSEGRYLVAVLVVLAVLAVLDFDFVSWELETFWVW